MRHTGRREDEVHMTEPLPGERLAATSADPSGATSEEYMRRVTVGEPTRLDGTVLLVDYSAEWPTLYAGEEQRIRRALGTTAAAVEHVGSTAVPGLVAKPIIDIDLAVPDSTDEATYVPALQAAGYVLRIREPEWFQHRLLRLLQGRDPAVNLHVFTTGCEEITRNLRFRDRLRSCEEDRALYARTKLRLAARTWTYLQDYADAKTAVIEEIIVRAEAAGAGQGQPPPRSG
jgi:GrpB-like predicted nucleotidyltransferase (UPF0157 family)